MGSDILDQLRRKIQSSRTELDATQSQIVNLKAKLKTTRESLESWLQAQSVLQDAAKAVQTTVHTQIVSVVTQCLQTVYDDSLEFAIDFEVKRGKTEARLYFKKNGHEVDPIEAGGLGWVEVASLALRAAILKLHSPAIAQVLILDESFRFLDADAKPKAAQLIMKLSKRMGIQFVLTTHDENFMIGKVVRIK